MCICSNIWLSATWTKHCCDVIMGKVASENIKAPRHWPLWPVNSLHKWPVTRKKSIWWRHHEVSGKCCSFFGNRPNCTHHLAQLRSCKEKLNAKWNYIFLTKYYSGVTWMFRHQNSPLTWLFCRTACLDVQQRNIKLHITVKPVCNDHFYYKIFYLWLIQ